MVKRAGQASNAGQELCARSQPPDSRSGQKTPILPRSVQGKSPLPTSSGQAVWKTELPQSGTPGAAAPGKAELLHCPRDPRQPSSGLRSLDARPRCQALRNSPQKEDHRVKQVPSTRPRAERGHVKRRVGSRPRNSNTSVLKGQGSQTTSFGFAPYPGSVKGQTDIRVWHRRLRNCPPPAAGDGGGLGTHRWEGPAWVPLCTHLNAFFHRIHTQEL